MALRFPNHPYYIPIIKWQSWEQRALLQTRGDVKPYVRPCIEVRHSVVVNEFWTLVKVYPASDSASTGVLYPL